MAEVETSSTSADLQARADALQKASEINDLIAELCVDAPSENVRSCLRSYQVGRSVPQIERDILKNKKAILCATGEFLQIPECAKFNKNELAIILFVASKIYYQMYAAYVASATKLSLKKLHFWNVLYAGKGCMLSVGIVY